MPITVPRLAKRKLWEWGHCPVWLRLASSSDPISVLRRDPILVGVVPLLPGEVVLDVPLLFPPDLLLWLLLDLWLCRPPVPAALLLLQKKRLKTVPIQSKQWAYQHPIQWMPSISKMLICSGELHRSICLFCYLLILLGFLIIWICSWQRWAAQQQWCGHRTVDNNTRLAYQSWNMIFWKYLTVFGLTFHFRETLEQVNFWRTFVTVLKVTSTVAEKKKGKFN